MRLFGILFPSICDTLDGEKPMPKGRLNDRGKSFDPRPLKMRFSKGVAEESIEYSAEESCISTSNTLSPLFGFYIILGYY